MTVHCVSCELDQGPVNEPEARYMHVDVESKLGTTWKCVRCMRSIYIERVDNREDFPVQEERR